MGSAAQASRVHRVVTLQIFSLSGLRQPYLRVVQVNRQRMCSFQFHKASYFRGLPEFLPSKSDAGLEWYDGDFYALCRPDIA